MKNEKTPGKKIPVKKSDKRRCQSSCMIAYNGSKYWYLNGKLHRTDGPACKYANGDKAWYLNGLLHRTDGPAVEYYDGNKEWHMNGELHRTDGPACEGANGSN